MEMWVPGVVAELQARLAWAFAVCARERPDERRGMDLRRVSLCPRCGAEARGFLGNVTLNGQPVAAPGAMIGTCSRCGALR